MSECQGVFAFRSDADKGFITVCYGLSSLGVVGGSVTSRISTSYYKLKPGELGEPVDVANPLVLNGNRVPLSALSEARINDDDLTDVVALGFSNLIFQFTQNEDGSFTQSTLRTSVLSFVTTVDSVDVTGDGIPDLVYSSFFDNAIAYYAGGADGYGADVVMVDAEASSVSALVVDRFTNRTSGPRDMLALLFDDGDVGSFAVVYRFNANGSKIRTAAANLENEGLRLASGDLDGDGRADAVYLTTNKLLWQSSGSGETPFDSQPLIELATGGGDDVITADLNNDGCNDVVLLRNRRIIIYANKCNGTLVRETSFTFGVRETSITLKASDLTDDGLLDLVVGSKDFMKTFRNLGDFVFEDLSQRTFPAMTTVFATIAFMDNDRFPDVLVGTVGVQSKITYYPNGTW